MELSDRLASRVNGNPDSGFVLGIPTLSHTHTCIAIAPMAPPTQLLPHHCPPPSLPTPTLPWPLIAFMPLFSQCEKFDSVHKRNSRIATGYEKSTCGSILPPLWIGLRICSLIDIFWARKDVIMNGQSGLSQTCATLERNEPSFLVLVHHNRAKSTCGLGN